MKPHLSRLTALLLSGLLLSGCAAPSSGHIDSEQNTNKPEDSSSSKMIAPTPPAEDAKGSLVSYDPNRQVYFSCQNIDSDIYLNSSFMPNLRFHILSLQHVDPEEIQISIPIQTEYAVLISECAEIRTTEYLTSLNSETGYIHDFPYYLYQCYRGTDWKKMGNLYIAAEQASNRQGELIMAGVSSSDSEYIQLQETIDEFHAYRDAYVEDFQALTPEDLPVFYDYEVQIFFGFNNIDLESYELSSGIRVSEGFHTVDIQLGNTLYTQEIGEIRLHAENLENIHQSHEDNLQDFSGIGIEGKSYPWGDGTECEMLTSFLAKKDLTITKLYFYESDIKLPGAHIIISSTPRVGTPELFEATETTTKDTSIDFYWDLETPIDIAAGTYVTIDLIFQDPRLSQMEYGGRLYPVMEYSVGTETHIRQTEINLDRVSLNSWLRYAIAFDGLDLESYFQDFYRPVYESWRENIPW